MNKKLKGLKSHLSIRLFTDYLQKRLIFADQQANHRIKKNQQWPRKAALQILNTIAINVLYVLVDPHKLITTIYSFCFIYVRELRSFFTK